jgi:MSHA type pilus biogenesis protein MshL
MEIKMKMITRFSCHGSQGSICLENRQNTDMLFRHRLRSGALILVALALFSFLAGCSKKAPDFRGEQEAQDFLKKHTSQAVNADAFKSDSEKEQPGPAELPSRFQQPTFLLSETESIGTDDFAIPVGADISSNAAPVTLREIMKKLAVLKGMNVSWANDVDQGALVDVDIRAEDDFFESIDNILRQLDYFHEVKGNSIIIKHKETRKFHISMPFMAPQFQLGVGGDVLGGNKVAAQEMSGKIQITSQPENANSFDIWANVRQNLDQILDIWTTEEVVTPPAPAPAGQQMLAGAQTAQPAVVTNRKPGKGYYTIDKPVGLITVTAPRSLVEKIANYIENLKKELYRQVSIEAKIVEVTLSADNRTGINWENLLQDPLNPFSLKLDFQKLNPDYRESGTQNKFLTVGTQNFSLVLDAIEEQGHVEVISNPKISVMNGQPAMISVGSTLTYIDTVDATVAGQSGTVTYSVKTSSVMSGLGMAVIATIVDDNEVILTLTPVTSKVKTPIDYKLIGNQGTQVGLPEVDIREMTTLVKIKNGEMLIVGGLIDSVSDYSESQIPVLGDIPGPGGKLFGESGAAKERKELVILLRPVILP